MIIALNLLVSFLVGKIICVRYKQQPEKTFRELPPKKVILTKIPLYLALSDEDNAFADIIFFKLLTSDLKACYLCHMGPSHCHLQGMS